MVIILLMHRKANDLQENNHAKNHAFRVIESQTRHFYNSTHKFSFSLVSYCRFRLHFEVFNDIFF